MKKKLICLIAALLFLVPINISVAVNGEITIDNKGDVIHYINNQWSFNNSSKPHIDIYAVTCEINQNQVRLGITLNGTIANSDKIVYQAYYITQDASYHLFYSNNAGYGIAKGNEGGEFKTTNVNVTGNNISCNINRINHDITNIELYVYVYEYTNLYDTAVEYWVDFAPDKYFKPENIFIDDDYNEETVGWQNTHFNKIQNGITIVKENGTVLVFEGNYHENLIINRPDLNIIGTEKERVVLIADQTGIKISANRTNIENFTIKRPGQQYDTIGIRIKSDNNSIKNILIDSVDLGIWGEDISFNIFEGNKIVNCTKDGLILEGVISEKHCHSNQILSNYIEGNSYGIWMEDTTNNMIRDNYIKSNTQYGIYIIEDSQNNIITHNEIAFNYIYGIVILSSNAVHNEIFGNSFKANGKFIPNIVTGNAYDIASNSWNKPYNEYHQGESNGNYWSNHDTTDNFKGPDYPQDELPSENGDGICDNPYYFLTNSIDCYPLVNPPTPFYINDRSKPILEIVFPQIGYIYLWKSHQEWVTLNDILANIRHEEITTPFPGLNKAVIFGGYKCQVIAKDTESGINKVQFFTIFRNDNMLYYEDKNPGGIGMYDCDITDLGTYDLIIVAYNNAMAWTKVETKVTQISAFGLLPDN